MGTLPKRIYLAVLVTIHCPIPDICGLHILMFIVEMRHLCNNNNNNKLMIHTLFYEGTVFTTVNQSLFN